MTKKVLFISSDNIYVTPYIEFYKNILNEQGMAWDILYWDKRGDEENIENGIRFDCKAGSLIKKVFGYILFSKKVRKALREDYDLIIPLHPILHILIFDILMKKYRRRYIFDIRDYSYEWCPLVRFMQKKLTRSSLINIISSKGYENFLPISDYYVCHNLTNEIKKNHGYPIEKSDRYRLSFLGAIRFKEMNIKIIDFFKNDERFVISFIGSGSETLEEYCRVNNIRNVRLLPRFSPVETTTFYKEIDAILNVYGSGTALLKYALSNKLYHAAFLERPIIVSPNTFMEEIGKKYGISFSLNMLDENEKLKLIEFIESSKTEEFKHSCARLRQDILLQQEITANILREKLVQI